ncbi:hypothetical protein [Salinimicrobium sp. GXAS 041]|uniref:hypothetical protein n=1 Tax=Salinimicrobium sp. GXAS 041 TaxID=3400806 RepID=UPI003C784549
MKKIFASTILVGTLFISCSKDDDNSPNEFTCDSLAEVIEEEDFSEINTSNYTLNEIQLSGNCLEVTVSSSGCDPTPWEMHLYSVNAFYTADPYARAVKIELINNQACLAVFQKTISFELTPFQLDGQDELLLNIEGWDQRIIYEY